MEDTFRGLELTDSFVLAFERHNNQFWVRALFSVQEDHPLYSKPGPEDYACYMHGWIKVAGIKEEVFEWKPQVLNYDPSGEVDFGSFEKAEFQGSCFSCVGDWGTLTMQCEQVEVLLD